VDGPDVAAFSQQLRDFTDLGLEVAITELDIPIPPGGDTALLDQAQAYRRVVESCLSAPGCTEITVWGVTDANTWLDGLGVFPTPTRPLLFDNGFGAKPAYDEVRAVLAEAVLARRAGPPGAEPTGPVTAAPAFTG
jgi:endo-1,4-beta-xylanase